MFLNKLIGRVHHKLTSLLPLFFQAFVGDKLQRTPVARNSLPVGYLTVPVAGSQGIGLLISNFINFPDDLQRIGLIHCTPQNSVSLRRGQSDDNRIGTDDLPDRKSTRLNSSHVAIS